MGEFKFISILATANASDVISDAIFVVIIGFSVVLAALLLLTAIFWLFGKFMQRGQKKSVIHNKQEDDDNIAPKLPIMPQMPVAETGISDEVVAVIAAAVAAMSDDGKSYTVRHVRRVVNRSAWATAGITESTRPF